MFETDSKSSLKNVSEEFTNIRSGKDLHKGFINAIKQKLAIDFSKLEHASSIKARAKKIEDDLRRDAIQRKKREMEIVKKILREKDRESKLLQYKENNENRWKKKWPAIRRSGVPVKEEYLSVITDKSDMKNNQADLTLIQEEEVIKHDLLRYFPSLKEETETENIFLLESEPDTGIPLKIEPFRKKLDFNIDTEMVADSKCLDALDARIVPTKLADFLVTEPRNMVFMNYTKNTEYAHKIKIFNLLSKKICCKFPTATSEADRVLKMFQVTPAYWVKILPYQSRTYIVKFRSNDLGHDFESLLKCLIVTVESINYSYFVPIRGISQKEDIAVEPKTLYLPPRGIWEVKKPRLNAFRTITIKSFMDKPYKVVIEKRITYDESNKKLRGIVTPRDSAQEIKELSEAFIKSHRLSSESRMLLPQTLKAYENIVINKTVLQMLQESIDNVFQHFFLTKRRIKLVPYGNCTVDAYFANATHIGFYQSPYDFKFYNPENKLCYTKSVLLMSEAFEAPIAVEPDTLDMRNSAVNYGVCQDYITVYNRSTAHSVSLKVKMPKMYQDIITAKPNVTTILPKSQERIAIKFCIKHVTHETEDMILHCPVDVYFKTCTGKYKGASPRTIQIYAPCNIKDIQRTAK